MIYGCHGDDCEVWRKLFSVMLQLVVWYGSSGRNLCLNFSRKRKLCALYVLRGKMRNYVSPNIRFTYCRENHELEQKITTKRITEISRAVIA
jgi:hypothetical protein